MIEMNIEFSDRIRSFLPKEISTRLTSQLAEADLSVPDAVKRVLTPATRTIACLFTDIRGFTNGTKGGDSFIYDGVIPNTSLCSALIEKYRGIPRKIGDLIFAYFDDPSIDVNLVRCLLAAFDIVEANSRFNRTNPQQISIRRYVLVATGNAEVGNLGGTDSSIEITAVGEPVDLLSRMDGLTKNPRFRERVRETDLILCPSTAARLRRMAVDWHIQRVPLAELDVGIRDFEEIDSVWVLATDDHNRRALSATERVMEEQRAATSAPNVPTVH
jgi:class 3 adenylate cyclase